MTFTAIESCRSCGGVNLHPVLDLGVQPLANAFRSIGGDGEESQYPLAIVRCGSCALVQLTGTVDPSEMFDEYRYFSSYSTTMLAAMVDLAGATVQRRSLSTSDLVVEVASNDGYLLKNYIAKGIRVLGIDPARNVADAARDAGVPTYVAYFGLDTADDVLASHGPAAVIHANNVLAHVPQVNDFVSGIARLLADDGIAIIETPHLLRMIDRCEFDTIYHEHVFYYSLTALSTLLERHGLSVCDVSELDIHGGSLRIEACHAGVQEPTQAVSQMLDREQEVGVGSDPYYIGFARAVESRRTETMQLLEQVRVSGRRIAGYGAAAKGTVLCNHFGIRPELMEYVVDLSPHKQGLVIPGVGIPIRPVSSLLENRPDYVLMLAWNFADEIIHQQSRFLMDGGKFVVPIPELRTVGA